MKSLLSNLFNPIIKLIHTKIQEYLLKRYKPGKHRQLLNSVADIFRSHGEGWYYVNIWSRNNNFMATVIGIFSDGISHTVSVYYSENLKSKFTTEQWRKITDSFNVYYGNKPGTPIPDSVKCLVIPSADEIGLVCCDFSKYQNRKISIRKAPMDKVSEIIAKNKATQIIGRPYDMVGLPAWLLGLRDDPYSYYCSEATYDIMKAGGLEIAKVDKPSPAQIEECRHDLIIFKN